MPMALRVLLLSLILVLPGHRLFADEARCDVKVLSTGTWRVTSELPIMTNSNSETMRKVRDGLALTLDFSFRFLSRAPKPYAGVDRRCHILYDLWAEKYIVSRSGDEAAKTFPLGREQDALKECMIADVPGPADARRVAVEAVLNPVDEKQQELTREWLATKGIGGSGVVGRAIGAVMNLKAEKRWTYECTP